MMRTHTHPRYLVHALLLLYHMRGASGIFLRYVVCVSALRLVGRVERAMHVQFSYKQYLISRMIDYKINICLSVVWCTKVYNKNKNKNKYINR